MFKLQGKNEFERLPQRSTLRSAGLDIFAAQTITCKAKQITMVETGLLIDYDWIRKNIQDYEAFLDKHYLGIHIRSSMAYKHGLMLANAEGIVDFDYPDPIGVLIYNSQDEDYIISGGEKIAQIIIQPHSTNMLGELYCISQIRTGGFGSTGK